jgi:hypothetical protein
LWNGHLRRKTGEKRGTREAHQATLHIEQEVRYKLASGHRIAENGRGITVSISSGGLWFTTENLLTAGIPVEISLNWPVMRNDSKLRSNSPWYRGFTAIQPRGK